MGFLTRSDLALTIDGASAWHAPVLAARGREALSAPFSYDIRVAVTLEEVRGFRGRVLGAPASLSIRTLGVERTVRGVIGQLVWGRGRGDFVDARLQLVPLLHLLGNVKRSRVFQDRTTVDILTRVLGEHRIRAVFKIQSRPVVRAYCVQYDETDRELVARLVGEEAWFYSFDEESTAIVFGDGPEAYTALAGGATLHHRGDQGAMRGAATDVLRFAERHGFGPRAVTQTDYDYGHPELPLTATFESPPVRREIDGPFTFFEHRGDYQNEHPTPGSARARLDQLRRDVTAGSGASSCPLLSPGRRFTLADHDIDVLNTGHVVTRVHHLWPAAGKRSYVNHFCTVRAETSYPASRPSRPLRTNVFETAVVVGTDGQETTTDELGRIRVRFHWHRSASDADSTSCLLRVIQSWGGASWGAQMIPRVGMEVLVGFLSGDIDRPVVVGSLYNATHPPPFAPPVSPAKSGIRSRSLSGGSGYNEITFDDARGAEQLALRAERDLDVRVGGDETSHVRGDRRHSADGAHHDSVAADRHEIVGGQWLQSSGADRRITVGGDSAETVRGTRKLEVTGPSFEARGAHSILRVAEAMSVVIGTDYSAIVGHQRRASATVRVEGKTTVVGSERIVLASDQAVSLVCGRSAIELRPDEIVLHSPSIRVAGSESVVLKGKGPEVRVREEIEMVSQVVKIYSGAASLEMDDEARLRGKRVHLNPKAGRPKDESATEEEAKTRKVRVAIHGAPGVPFAAKHYRLVIDALRLEGVTGQDGVVDQEVPADATTADLFVWPEAFPEGPTRHFHLNFEDLPPASTIAGAQARLGNLGHYDGARTGTLDRATRAALIAFQEEQGLDETGELDADTVQALAERAAV